MKFQRWWERSRASLVPCLSPCHAEAFETLDVGSLPGHISTVIRSVRAHDESLSAPLSKYILGAFNELLVYARVAQHHHHHHLSLSLSLLLLSLLAGLLLVLPLHLSIYLSIYPTSQSSQAQIFNPPRLVSRRDGSTERSHSNPIPDLFIMI